MAAIYILSDYGKLGKKDETIVFSQPDGTNTILFPFKTEHLVIIGNVSISGNALRLISKYKIPVTFLSSNGRFNAKLSFGDSKNVFLRQKQYRILDNPECSLRIAKSIVAGKIRNEISFMQRIKRKDGIKDNEVLKAIAFVKQTLPDIEVCNGLEQLRGYEGVAAKKYFEVFGYNIQPEWAVFKTRSKNPPKSNVNAVMSFLYTLLLYKVESAVEAQGLDPCAGNLHALNYGNKALVFDLMEEFRSPVADSVCCTLFNLGTLKEEDFYEADFFSESMDFPLEKTEEDVVVIPDSSNEDGTEEYFQKGKGVLLNKPALKKVISAFEGKMNSLILYPPSGQKISYTKIIYAQAEHYKRVILGEETEYKAYFFK